MRWSILAVALLLSACSVRPPAAVKPATLVLTRPEVIIKTRRVYIIERRSVPVPARDPVGPALLRDYAELRPVVTRAVVQSKRPAAIDHLTTLDRRVKRAMRPFMSRHHNPTPAEVDEAIASLTELKAAAATTPKGP